MQEKTKKIWAKGRGKGIQNERKDGNRLLWIQIIDGHTPRFLLLLNLQMCVSCVCLYELPWDLTDEIDWAETEAVGLLRSLSPLAILGFPLSLSIASWQMSMNHSSSGRTLQTSLLVRINQAQNIEDSERSTATSSKMLRIYHQN